MSAPNAIELVCFDLGGVLVRICRTWGEACRRAGTDVRGDAAGDRADAARRELAELYSRGRVSRAEWIDRLGIAMSGLYTKEELSAIHAAVTIEEYPGVGEVIEKLHRASVATACLSNTDHDHWAHLIHHDGVQPLAGDPRYPSVRRLGSHHASHLMGLAKPDHAIYRAFERATGTAGKHILFFDDLPENVESARSVGWRAERIDPNIETAAQLRHHLEVYGIF